MEYGRIVREAWSITLRTRSLWWLGVIASVQLAASAIILGGLAAPLAALPQLATSVTAARVGPTATSSAVLSFVIAAGGWLDAHMGAIVIGSAVVLSAWLALGAVDVAAQTGLITQVDRVADHGAASVRTGLRDGFRLWWRAVALLALAALPSMAYLLVMALVVFLTVSLPLYLGQAPSPGASLFANAVLSPLSAIASVVSIPLAVLVQLALRFAVLREVTWRPAFRSAWELVRANLAEVAIAYVLVAIVSFVALGVFALSVGIVAVVVGALFLGLGLVMTSGDTAAAGRIALVGTTGFAVLLFVAFQGVMFVWQSSTWTLVWRDRTELGSAFGTAGGVRAISRGSATSTTEGSV